LQLTVIKHRGCAGSHTARSLNCGVRHLEA